MLELVRNDLTLLKADVVLVLGGLTTLVTLRSNEVVSMLLAEIVTLSVELVYEHVIVVDPPILHLVLEVKEISEGN